MALNFHVTRNPNHIAKTTSDSIFPSTEKFSESPSTKNIKVNEQLHLVPYKVGSQPPIIIVRELCLLLCFMSLTDVFLLFC